MILTLTSQVLDVNSSEGGIRNLKDILSEIIQILHLPTETPIRVYNYEKWHSLLRLELRDKRDFYSSARFTYGHVVTASIEISEEHFDSGAIAKELGKMKSKIKELLGNGRLSMQLVNRNGVEIKRMRFNYLLYTPSYETKLRAAKEVLPALKKAVFHEKYLNELKIIFGEETAKELWNNN